VGWAGERAPGSQRVLTPQTKKNIVNHRMPSPIFFAAESSDYETYLIDPNTVARNTTPLHPELVLPAGAQHMPSCPMIRSLNDDALPSVQSSVQSRI